MRPIRRRLAAVSLALVFVVITPASRAFTQTSVPAEATTEQKPYDEKLMRLSELLGALHFLRELCGGNDGMTWRDRMREIIDAEGTTAARRMKFTRAFNAGYRGYNRSYTTCTPTARTTIERFLAEGTELADGLVKSAP
ncbi:MAG TPA: TIGR02301 family protein [Hyphomicrobiaceae bacterium]|nr:TIGR02301 family protein [Hyphomicrobiaceae bacterium]